MTSGFAWPELGLEGTPESAVTALFRSTDWIKFILDKPMSTAPGVDFNYNSGNQHLLSAILTKLSGMSSFEYAKEKLFGPVGIKDLYWQHDPQGVPRINGLKGTWQDDRTFVIDRLAIGLDQSPERWTLAFEGNSLKLRVKFSDGPEIAVQGEAEDKQ